MEKKDFKEIYIDGTKINDSQNQYKYYKFSNRFMFRSQIDC